MKKKELANRIIEATKDLEKAHVSDFNRKVISELANTDFTGEVDNEAVKTAERLLQSFLNETWPEEPSAHKYVINACLALAFLLEKPMHPQEIVHYITRVEDGKEHYYCSYNEPGTICDYCAAVPAKKDER